MKKGSVFVAVLLLGCRAAAWSEPDDGKPQIDRTAAATAPVKVELVVSSDSRADLQKPGVPPKSERLVRTKASSTRGRLKAVPVRQSDPSPSLTPPSALPPRP